MIAFWVACTRVVDYRHNPSDINVRWAALLTLTYVELHLCVARFAMHAICVCLLACLFDCAHAHALFLCSCVHFSAFLRACVRACVRSCVRACACMPPLAAPHSTGYYSAKLITHVPYTGQAGMAIGILASVLSYHMNFAPVWTLRSQIPLLHGNARGARSLSSPRHHLVHADFQDETTPLVNNHRRPSSALKVEG